MQFAVGDGRAEVRTSYPPRDGGPTVREIARGLDSLDLPWPDGDDMLDVAALLAAAPDQPWNEVQPLVFRGTDPFLFGSVYLAGSRDDGSTGAVALYSDRPRALFEAVFPLGANLTVGDLAPAVGRIFELEIRGIEPGVRIRWGRDPGTYGGKPWDGGSVVIPAADLLRGETTALDPLREFLRSLGRGPDRPDIVLLEADARARYVDVLRVVECGAGRDDVWFLPYPGWTGPMDLEDFRIVEAGFVSDVRGPDPAHETAFANVTRDGQIIIKKRVMRESDLAGYLDDRTDAGLILRADRHADWSACRIVVRAARSRGRRLGAWYAPLAGLPHEQLLDLPLPGDESTIVDAEVARSEDGALRVVRPERLVEGMAIRFRVPDGVAAGPVLRLVAELRAAGVLVDPD